MAQDRPQYRRLLAAKSGQNSTWHSAQTVTVPFRPDRPTADIRWSRSRAASAETGPPISRQIRAARRGSRAWARACPAGEALSRVPFCTCLARMLSATSPRVRFNPWRSRYSAALPWTWAACRPKWALGDRRLGPYLGVLSDAVCGLRLTLRTV